MYFVSSAMHAKVIYLTVMAFLFYEFFALYRYLPLFIYHFITCLSFIVSAFDRQAAATHCLL